MSLECFIAADKELKEYSVGVEERGNAIIIEDEWKVLSVFCYEDNDIEGIKLLTEKPVLAGMQFNDLPTIENNLLAYVSEAMTNNTSIEIWYTWNFESDWIETMAKNIDELAVNDLKWVLGDDYYDHPKCLKIYKYTRGKK